MLMRPEKRAGSVCGLRGEGLRILQVFRGGVVQHRGTAGDKHVETSQGTVILWGSHHHTDNPSACQLILLDGYYSFLW